MRPTKPLIASIMIFTLVMFGIATMAEARPPQPPHHFWGEVAPGGTPVEPGTNISVWTEIAGNDFLVASVESSMDSGEAIYTIFVMPDNPESPERDGAIVGDTLHFTVENELMNYEIEWEPGGSTHLDLTDLFSTTPTTTTTTSTTTTTTTTTPTGDGLFLAILILVGVGAAAGVVLAIIVVYSKFVKK